MSATARRAAWPIVLVSGLAIPAAVQAADPPARNGPIWNGHQHEPTPSTTAEERNVGVAPPPGQARAEQGTVDQLYRNLTGGDPQAGTVAGPNGTQRR